MLIAERSILQVVNKSVGGKKDGTLGKEKVGRSQIMGQNHRHMKDITYERDIHIPEDGCDHGCDHKKNGAALADSTGAIIQQQCRKQDTERDSEQIEE